jgi:alkylation response protein AidB-like acyl-CoA dehydrogenase
METRADRFLIHGRTRGFRSGAWRGTLIVVAKHQGEESRTATLIDTAQQGVHVRPGEAFDEFEFADFVGTEAGVLGERGDGFRILSAQRSDARLWIAAGCVGTLEGSLEVIASIASERLRTGEWAQGRQAIEHYVTCVATDLEASRGLVYAAAELKADFDRRPTSKHLASESSTLIREANYFATQSIHRLHSGAESIEVGNRTLLDFVPARYRIAAGSNDLFEESGQALERDIAVYYLDL